MINPMKPDEYVIGADLGGTHIRVAAVSATGKLSARVKRPSQGSPGYKNVVKNIRSAIKEVALKKKSAPLAIGLASAGAIDFSKNVVISSPNFPGWKNVPLAKDAGSVFACPAILENDANSAALGEGRFGAAKGWDDFVMLTLGTGVGGGVILNRKIWRGSSTSAGEIGHITVNPGGRLCACGNKGCLETTASASGIAASARALALSGDYEWLSGQKRRRGIGRIDTELVARGALLKDPACLKLLRDAGRDIGAAMAAVALALGVSRFVIGGGAAPAFKFMKPSARKAALSMAYTLTGPKLKIVSAGLGDDAGIMGAALLAMERIE
ncbi:MAG TPA: ROK family protein [Nitrospirae bacterium]|nr:ROK family protein [Nitrospirota bacterium]